MMLTCPARPAEIAGLRAAAGSWLSTHGVGDNDCMELVLVVSELATNAVQVSPAPDSPIELRLALDDDLVSISMIDEGPGFDSDELQTAMAGVDAPNGRGLPIVAAMSDHVVSSRIGAMTLVRVDRRLTRDRTRPRGE